MVHALGGCFTLWSLHWISYYLLLSNDAVDLRRQWIVLCCEWWTLSLIPRCYAAAIYYYYNSIRHISTGKPFLTSQIEDMASTTDLHELVHFPLQWYIIDGGRKGFHILQLSVMIPVTLTPTSFNSWMHWPTNIIIPSLGRALYLMLNCTQYIGHKLGGHTANNTIDSCLSFCHSSRISDTRLADFTSSRISSLRLFDNERMESEIR